MSIFQRAVSAAMVGFALIALAGQSKAGNAAELVRVASTVPANAAPGTQEVSDDSLADRILTGAELAQDADEDAGDVIAYPTLAAAVAAQEMPAALDEQLRCMAGAIYFEAKGEPLTGQLAVAEVILNRASSGRFRPDVCSVITQRGQFSFVRGGSIPAIDASRAAYRTAVAVAKVALDDAWESAAPRALFFHAKRLSPRWNKTRVALIGNHVFYR